MTELTEPLEQPPPPEVVPESVDPVEPGDELARKNMLFGLALFGLFLLLFAGVWLVAFIYLALD
ncbi:MAG TPA: hypothetical protein VIF36_02770 [Gaiellaceae bacterium]